MLKHTKSDNLATSMLRRKPKKEYVSSGLLNSLAYLSAARALLEVSVNIDNGEYTLYQTENLCKINWDPVELEALNSYRLGIIDRLFKYFETFAKKGVVSRVKTKTDKLATHTIKSFYDKPNLSLDLLSIYIFKSVYAKPNTPEELKQVIHIEELDYLETLLIQSKQLGKLSPIKHKLLAKDFVKIL